MSLFLPEELKREIARYLHKKYYVIVLDELLLMTNFIRKYFDIAWNLIPRESDSRMRIIPAKCIIMKTGDVWYKGDDSTISVARWRYNPSFTGYERKSIQEIKIELNTH